MQFGVQHPNFSHDGEGLSTADSLKQLVTSVERLGYDSFWVMDHFHQIRGVAKPTEPILESWTTLAVMAGVTSRVKLGTLVSGNVYRHPSVVAKIGATLDVLSNGRLFMGIGAAWNQDEAYAYGIPFPPTAERMRRLEEAVQIIRAMWTEDPANFDGIFYKIRNAHCNPKPIQNPHPPIMIGGGGEQQTLKLVAKYADACNIFGSVSTVKNKLTILREHCKSVNRNYDSIRKTRLGRVMIDRDKEKVNARAKNALKGMPEAQVKEFLIYGTPEELHREVQRFSDAGIEYFIASFDPTREREELDMFAREVAAKF